MYLQQRNKEMKIEHISGNYTVCQVSSLPDVSQLTGIWFLQRTNEELSLVCETSCAPKETLARQDGWYMLRVCGSMEFSLIGILASITQALADAGVAVFAVSTYNTDYILIPSGSYPDACHALSRKGWLTGTCQNQS